MSITIIDPGLLATIQDKGRYRLQKYGIPVSGTMDPVSLEIAQMLVGNDPSASGLEFSMYGAKLRAEKDMYLSITGAKVEPTVDDERVSMWAPIFVHKGQIIHIPPATVGNWIYVAVAGRMNLPFIMGSQSTYTRARIGGREGRALKKGDTIEWISFHTQAAIFKNQVENNTPHWSVNGSAVLPLQQNPKIRVLKGSEYHRFDASSQQAFSKDSYTVTLASDRMGYQLKGQPLRLADEFNLLSEGVTYGTIQVPTSGQPIILMADRQTTGGYPKIAQVIRADLPLLAQARPGSKLQFTFVSLKDAEDALIQQRLKLSLLAREIAQKF